MKKWALYNEIDPFAADWLRRLILLGHIAPGEVTEVSIEDLCPSDVAPFAQFHAFAGIGVWSYALRQAGVPDGLHLWTGSCPCQPFSAAGKGAGFDDERHLWPTFLHLIRECRPDVVLGEQVASKDGLAWLDLVQADLEGEGYASGALDTCAAGFGAPHIRQRLYWVGAQKLEHTPGDGRLERGAEPGGRGIAGGRGLGELADADGRQHRDRDVQLRGELRLQPQNRSPGGQGDRGTRPETAPAVGTLPVNGLWRDADWLFCRDGRWRPVEPGTFPLAHGASARVGRLRGYGNAINAAQAQGFIEAVMEAMP